MDPGQFLSACELIVSAAPCTLAHAFVNLCQQNYIPLEVPAKCCKLESLYKVHRLHKYPKGTVVIALFSLFFQWDSEVRTR